MSNEPCPMGRTDYDQCFAPFRYCPEKGCGRTEDDNKPPVPKAPTREDQVRAMLAMARGWAESAPEQKSMDVAQWPRIHLHYNPAARTCDHGGELPLGWMELGMEAENAQQLLDFAGIPDGHPQGRGDVDWRVAEAVLRLSEGKSRLSAIAAAHARETGPAGMVGDYCIECDRRWPCPTYQFAHGDRDPSLPWDPADDEDDVTGGSDANPQTAVTGNDPSGSAS